MFLSTVGYVGRSVVQRDACIMFDALGRLTRARGVVALGCASRAGRPDGHTAAVERAVARVADLVRIRSCETLLAMAGRSGIVRQARS